MKFEFNDLRGLFVRGHELPFLDRVFARLHEQRMSAKHSRALHMTVGCDNDFNLHSARHVHALRELRIRWSNTRLHFALPFLCATLRETYGTQHQGCRSGREAQSEDACCSSVSG